jgi:hypothetical protein
VAHAGTPRGEVDGPPRGRVRRLAAAILYADDQWEELGVFLDDERGASIAGLYSLVATCEARGINPFEYLADVLAREA